MDPDQTVRAMRSMSVSYLNGGKWDEYDTTTFLALFDSLDKWLSSGGVMPQQWNRKDDK